MNEDFIGLGTLLLIFGLVLIPIGIYILTGHKNELIVLVIGGVLLYLSQNSN